MPGTAMTPNRTGSAEVVTRHTSMDAPTATNAQPPLGSTATPNGRPETLIIAVRTEPSAGEAKVAVLHPGEASARDGRVTGGAAGDAAAEVGAAGAALCDGAGGRLGREEADPDVQPTQMAQTASAAAAATGADFSRSPSRVAVWCPGR
jgi:hypothetical protein